MFRINILWMTKIHEGLYTRGLLESSYKLLSLKALPVKDSERSIPKIAKSILQQGT